jgi:Ca2+-binding RTX toxin-like protein
MAIPEYASNIDDGYFVSHMADWIKSNNVVYQSYWDSNSAFSGDLADHPNNLAAFEAAWGAGAAGAGGTVTPTPAPAPVPAPTPAPISGGTTSTGTHTLVLNLSGDAWQGDAQAVVTVDGQQVAGPLTVTALHSHGADETFTIKGNWAAGAHQVGVTFINDAWGGTPQTDRNLYVDGASFDGHAVAGAAMPLYAPDSTDSFGITVGGSPVPAPAPAPAPAPTPAPSGSGNTNGSGAHTLVLNLSEDAWQGDAQAVVTVDGQQVAGPLTVTASHSAGADQTFTINGDWAPGTHQIGVTFINDAWGGTPQMDRNLYVDGASFDGHTVSGAAQPLYTPDATDSFTVTEAGSPAPAPTPAPSPVPASGSTGSGIAEATPDEMRTYVAADATGVAHGTAGADEIFATGSGETLIGNGGNDIFEIGTYTDAHIVVGASGITQVSTYAPQYTLAVGVNNLWLGGTYNHAATGNGLNNYIYGSNGNDTINGGGGNVTIQVGTGANTLTGGGQHDTFVFNQLADHDNVITDFHPGHDVLDLRGLIKDAGYTGTNPVNDHVLAFQQMGSDTAVVVDPNAANAYTVVTLHNVVASSLHAGTDYLWH